MRVFGLLCVTLLTQARAAGAVAPIARRPAAAMTGLADLLSRLDAAVHD